MTSRSDPARKGVAVTPSDATELAQFRGFHVGGAGDVAIENPDGSTVTYVGCAAGGTYAYEGVKILATGTDATSIVALY